MAKLSAMPEESIISGFRGVVDFYEYLGIPCARAWPQFKGTNWPQSVRDTWPTFAAAARGWNTCSDVVRAAYRRQAATTDYSPRDLFVAMYITNMYRLPYA